MSRFRDIFRMALQRSELRLPELRVVQTSAPHNGLHISCQLDRAAVRVKNRLTQGEHLGPGGLDERLMVLAFLFQLLEISDTRFSSDCL